MTVRIKKNYPMINTKKELEFYIMADRMMNCGVFRFSFRQKLYNFISPDCKMKFLEMMRKSCYYTHCGGGVISSIPSSYYKFMQRKYGVKMGFNIANDVLGYGVVIPHYGTIVVGGGNKIGNYAVLHTSTCITNGKKVIGDGLSVSTGAKLTTVEHLGDNVIIAANSVVTKNFEQSGILLAGMPATIKKETNAWYENSPEYSERVRKVEELKKKMKI